jgi:hypothetical protein
MKPGFCACAITFQTVYNSRITAEYTLLYVPLSYAVRMSEPFLSLKMQRKFLWLVTGQN